MGLIKLKDVLPPEQPTPEELAAQQHSEAPDASEAGPGSSPPQSASNGPGAPAGPPGAPPTGDQGMPPPTGDPGAPTSDAGGQPTGGLDSTVTPELQQAYDKAMYAAGTILFKDAASHAQIVKGLRAGKDQPAKTVGGMAAAIVGHIDEASGRKLPPEIIYGLGSEVTEQLCDIAKAVQAFPVDSRLLQQAGQAMILALSDMYDVQPDEVNKMVSSFSPNEQEAMRAQQDEIANGGEVGSPPGGEQPQQPAGGAMGMAQAMPPQGMPQGMPA